MEQQKKPARFLYNAFTEFPQTCQYPGYLTADNGTFTYVLTQEKYSQNRVTIAIRPAESVNRKRIPFEDIAKAQETLDQVATRLKAKQTILERKKYDEPTIVLCGGVITLEYCVDEPKTEEEAYKIIQDFTGLQPK